MAQLGNTIVNGALRVLGEEFNQGETIDGNLDVTTINGVTVGSSPKFTDANVSQTADTANSNYEVLFSATADNTNRTEGTKKAATLRFNPSKGALMEGSATVATGTYTHAEGYKTSATGEEAHAEGANTLASGSCSHAEGYNTSATSGSGAHAEGSGTSAAGAASHAEGYQTTASGSYAHAGGRETIASTAYQTAIGKWNISDSTSAFIIGNGTSTTRSNAFSVQFNGTVKAASTITASTTADYAEYFEWADENPNDEDRVGYFIAFDSDNKIKIGSNLDEYILGISSGEPFVLGNGDCDVWNGMVLRDDFRRVIYEPAPKLDDEGNPMYDEQGNPIYEGTRPKLNPKYDPTRPYINRADRPEWQAVGMLGVLAVRDNGQCQINGYCTVASDGTAKPYTDGDIHKYRVIHRNSNNVIEIVFR